MPVDEAASTVSEKPFGSPSLSDRSRLSTDASGSEGQAAEDEDLKRRSMTKEDRMYHKQFHKSFVKWLPKVRKVGSWR